MPASDVAHERRPREPAIDLAKGCAILCVLLIHSEALHGNFVFRHVVNQAVPIFVVLFGVNATLWWRSRDVATAWPEWYRGRLDRIMVPVWAMLPLWWALALWFRPFGVPLTWWLPFVHAAGYLLHVGTGWFVTMILQLVLLQPLLEAAARRVGRGALFACGALATAIATAGGLWLVDRLGLFNFFVFAPRFFAAVTFGMLLAAHVPRLRWRAGVGAAIVWAAAIALQEGHLGFPWEQEAFWIAALPLTVLALVAVRPLARIPAIGPALTWLGQSSYGVYVGQMITHNAFVYGFGLRDLYVRVDPWLYTAILLVGGVGFTWIGEELRGVVGSLGVRRARTATA